MHKSHLSRQSRFISIGLVLLVGAMPLTAATYIVAQKHVQASDDNPGTAEAPFKTLAHAGQTAQAGDQVFIREGIYRETLRVEHSGLLNGESRQQGNGRVPDRIEFEAYGDDKVIIDGSEIVPVDWWHPVDGVPGVYVADLSNVPETWHLSAQDKDRIWNVRKGLAGFVFFNDKLLDRHQLRNLQTGEWVNAVPTAERPMSRHFDVENRRLYVHLGGADPRREGRVEIVARMYGIWTTYREYITLSKLTVRRVGSWGIEATRTVGLIMEDCNIHHAFTAFRVGGNQPIVRRNRVHHIIGAGSQIGKYGVQVYDNIFSDVALAGASYNTHAIQSFRTYNGQYLHNIAYQSPSIGHGGAFWPDCPSVGNIWRGNAGIYADYYIEAIPISNLLQWNTCLYRHIYLRHNHASTVVENLVAWSKGDGLMLGSGSQWNTLTGNWLKGNRIGISVHAEVGKPGIQRSNIAQGNVYEIPEGGYAANWAGHPYKTLEEFRAVTGQETIGREEEIDLDKLGLVWVRLDEVEGSHKPFPLFGNPDLSRVAARMENFDPLFFWRRGDTEWRGDSDLPDRMPYHTYPLASLPGSAKYSGSRLSDPRTQARPRPQTGLDGLRSVAPVDGTPVAGRVYVVSSFNDMALDKRGFGMWSPSLPVVAGATIDISAWMHLHEVTPVAEDGGAVVFVEWSDWNAQNKSRSYVVGGDTADSLVNPEFNGGSRDWSRVSGHVTAPDGAKRFALFLGMHNASGQVMYGAVDQLNTRAGEPPAEEAIGKKETHTPPLKNPASMTFQIVDLSSFVNRALADEEADDGVGGWADQGSGYDMNGIETGRREHEGVPYVILEPKSAIVLNAPRTRAQSDLPESVAIPIGTKADAFYFLHSGAWVNPGFTHPIWKYVLQYEDGATHEIPVISGVNIRDWSVAGLPYTFLDTDARRTTVWPQTVGNTLSPDCGLYILEHLNPHPELKIEEIRFVGDEKQFTVPILLAITLGREKTGADRP